MPSEIDEKTQKLKDYKHKWYLEHMELTKARTSQWIKNNIRKVREGQRKRRAENPEEYRAASRKNRAEHPDKNRDAQKKYRETIQPGAFRCP